VLLTRCPRTTSNSIESVKTQFPFDLHRSCRHPPIHHPLHADTSPAPPSREINVPRAISSRLLSPLVSVSGRIGTFSFTGKPKRDKILRPRFVCRMVLRRVFWLWDVRGLLVMGFIGCFGSRLGRLGCFDGFERRKKLHWRGRRCSFTRCSLTRSSLTRSPLTRSPLTRSPLTRSSLTRSSCIIHHHSIHHSREVFTDGL
jgi:hypothetical protein